MQMVCKKGARKIKINIILGFLEAGKTSFINSILKSEYLENDNIIVIQDEYGEVEIEQANNNIITIKNQNIDAEFIKKIINEYNPDKVFIEYNGMKEVDKILNIFNEKILRKKCILNDIISVIDCKMFNMYLKNMKPFLADHIFNSKSIVLRNTDIFSKDEIENIKKEINSINETVKLYEQRFAVNEENEDIEEYVEITNKYSILKISIISSIIIFMLTYIGTIIMVNDINGQAFEKFKNIYIKFISILIEGIPFILIGSFVSAIIQVCIKEEIFIKILPKNIFLSCIIAAFAGFLFPVCDCGTIPILRSITKKGVNIGVGITFMLASPIVNPISIMSTIYAFKGMQSVIIYRVVMGITIAIIVGLIIGCFYKNSIDIFNEKEESIECECELCNLENSTKIDKIKIIFIHTGNEFFYVGKFLILGIFLSSILQSILPVNNISAINDDKSSLIIMMALAFLFSLCSTSDSFVSKSFLGQFSINSVMGFLIFGPMLDLKNVLMLMASFKKSFILKVVIITFLVTFIMLINFRLV